MPQSVVPVFPLPGVVFFPRTVLPLHVFEPRYRAMVRDAAAGAGLIAVSLLRPGWESDYVGSPAFHDVGTVGRMEDLESLPDGRFNLRLVGLARVRFGPVVSDAPYRSARYEAIPEILPSPDDAEIHRRKVALLTSHVCLLREIGRRDGPGILFDENVGLAEAVNEACASLPVEPDRRQSLLELDDLERRMESAGRILDRALESVLRLRALRGGEDWGSGPN